MPLFDLHPKESPAALFGREPELDQLVRLVNEGRWAAVLGPRMVGKTSLVKAAIRRVDRPAIYVNLWGARGTLGFVHAFVHGLNSSHGILRRIRGALRRVEGVSIGPSGVSVSAPPRPLRTVWDLLDLLGGEVGRSLVELDEVQEVAAASPTVLKLLANVFNTHPEVAFVFTGSRFGLLKTLLEPGQNSPLFGRPPAVVQLEPFTRERSVDFLEAGFREYRLEFDRERIEQVVDRSLDGIPGWLTLYGNQVAVQRLDPEAAERATLKEGMRVAQGELAHFLLGRDRGTFWAALKLLSASANWTELRDWLSQRRGQRVNDNTVRNVLQALQTAGLVTAADERYSIADPMIRAYLKGAGPRPPRSAD